MKSAADFTLTVEQARQFIDEAIAERGENYVYNEHFESCAYVNPETGEPQCIVGYVLIKAGLDPEFFKDSEPHYGRNYSTINGWQLHNQLNLYPKLEYALRQAQIQQDSGKTWNKARWAFNEAINS